MDDVPPSYAEAMTRDAWQLIAPYASSTSLCTLARVNHAFHSTFTPFLWGNPAAHFAGDCGNDDPELRDRVFGLNPRVISMTYELISTVALTRFKRTLQRVRLKIRELTHTLHFPPAHAEVRQMFGLSLAETNNASSFMTVLGPSGFAICLNSCPIFSP